MTRHHPHPRRLLAAAAATGLLASGLWAAAPALAHDQLLSAEPGDGATLQTAPEELLLSFSGNLITGQGIQNLVQVRDQDGHQWQDGAATVTGPTLSAALCDGMPNGDYDVSYRVVYSDGHSEEKQYTFTVQDPNGPDTGAPADGCGVLAAGASPSSPAGTEPTQDQGTTTAPSGAESTAPGAGETAPAEDTVVEDSSQESAPLPAWVWAVGFGGVAVVVLGLVVAARKAKSLG